MSSDLNDAVASLLTSRTIGFVVRCLRRLGAPPAAAEDLAQDVLLTAMTSMRFDPSQPLEPWLWGIAKAKLRDFRDLAWNRRVVLARDGLDASGQAVEVCASVADADQLLAAALWRALQVLDDASQTLIVLHDLEAWSLSQCADALHISSDAAKYRLTTARKLLKKQLMLTEGVHGE